MNQVAGEDRVTWHLTPIEIHTDVSFSSATTRRDHVLKHVFGIEAGADPPPEDDGDPHRRSGPKQEHWRRVLKEGYADALRAIRRGDLNSDAMKKVEEAYERMLSCLFREKCDQGRDHVHGIAVDDFEVLENRASLPTEGRIRVFVACPNIRVWSVAAAFVRGSTLGRYHLLSGYRPWPELGGAGFRRRAREKLMREQDRMRLVADHTQWYE